MSVKENSFEDKWKNWNLGEKVFAVGQAFIAASWGLFYFMDSQMALAVSEKFFKGFFLCAYLMVVCESARYRKQCEEADVESES